MAAIAQPNGYRELLQTFRAVEENRLHVKNLAILPIDFALGKFDKDKFHKAEALIPPFLAAMETYYGSINRQHFDTLCTTRDTLESTFCEWDEDWHDAKNDSWIEPYRVIEFGTGRPDLIPSGKGVYETAQKVDEQFALVLGHLSRALKEGPNEVNEGEFKPLCETLMERLETYWKTELRAHEVNIA